MPLLFFKPTKDENEARKKLEEAENLLAQTNRKIKGPMIHNLTDIVNVIFQNIVKKAVSEYFSIKFKTGLMNEKVTKFS